MGCRKPGGPGLAAIGDWIEAGRVADEDFLRSHGLNKSVLVAKGLGADSVRVSPGQF